MGGQQPIRKLSAPPILKWPRVQDLGQTKECQSLGRMLPLPRFEAFVSRFPPTPKREICLSSLQGLMGLVRRKRLVCKSCQVFKKKCTRFRKVNLPRKTGTKSVQSSNRANQTRFRTYDNSFDAGVVLPRFTGPRPLCADRHTTTNIIKPPDPGENHDNIITLRTVAHATANSTGSTKTECGLTK